VCVCVDDDSRGLDEMLNIAHPPYYVCSPPPLLSYSIISAEGCEIREYYVRV